jgi:hypothetical protein
VVVSAKISRKYSGGVLRGSIPARERTAQHAVGRLVQGDVSKEEKFTGAKRLVEGCWPEVKRSWRGFADGVVAEEEERMG